MVLKRTPPLIDLTNDDHDGDGGRRGVTPPTQTRAPPFSHVQLQGFEQYLPQALGDGGADNDNFFNAAFPDMDWDALIMENGYHQPPPPPAAAVAGPAQGGQWFDFEGEQVFVPDEKASPAPVDRGIDKVDVAMHDVDEPTGMKFTADMCVEHVTGIFPDVDPEYVRELWSDGGLSSSFGPQRLGLSRIEVLLDKLIADGTYPKISKGKQVERKRKREGTPNEDDDEFARSVALYSRADRSFTPGTLRIMGNMLKAEFPQMTRQFIATHMLPPENLWKTYINMAKALDAPADSGMPLFGRGRPVKQPELASAEVIAANSHHPELAQELETVRRYVAKQRAEKKAEEARRQAEEENFHKAIAAGETAECQACFESLPMNRQIHCSGETAHFTCFECADTYVRSEVSEARCRVLCTAGCGAGFAPDQLGQLSDKQALARLAQLQQDKDIRDAGLDDLEECPFCDYKAILPPIEEDFEFRCANPDCARVSCRRCKAVSHVPITCEEHAREHRQSARHVVEEAMTAALKRTCNNCKKSYIKDYGCNKMKCPSCGTLQCYVCSETVSDYKHFDQTHLPYANRAGPVREQRCPLYDDVEARHEREVKEAEDAARAQVLAEHPDVQPDDLKIDMPADSPATIERRRRARDFMAPFAVPVDRVLPGDQILGIAFLDVAAVPDDVWQRFEASGDVNILPEILRQQPRAELDRLRRQYEIGRAEGGQWRAHMRAQLQAELDVQRQVQARAEQQLEILGRRAHLWQDYAQAEEQAQQRRALAPAVAEGQPFGYPLARNGLGAVDPPARPRRGADQSANDNRLAGAAARPADGAPAPDRNAARTAGTQGRRVDKKKKKKRRANAHGRDGHESAGEWSDTDDSDSAPKDSDSTSPPPDSKNPADQIRRTMADIRRRMRPDQELDGLLPRDRADWARYMDEYDRQPGLVDPPQRRAPRPQRGPHPLRDATNVDSYLAPPGDAKAHEKPNVKPGAHQQPQGAATTLGAPRNRAPFPGKVVGRAVPARVVDDNDLIDLNRADAAYLDAPPAYEPLATQAQVPQAQIPQAQAPQAQASQAQAPAAPTPRADKNPAPRFTPAREWLRERRVQENEQRHEGNVGRRLVEPNALPPQYPQNEVNVMRDMAAMAHNAGPYYQPYPYAWQVDGAAAEIPAAPAYDAAVAGQMFYQPYAILGGVNGNAYGAPPNAYGARPNAYGVQPHAYGAQLNAPQGAPEILRLHHAALARADAEERGAPAGVRAVAQHQGQGVAPEPGLPPVQPAEAPQAQPDPDPTQELERQMVEDDLVLLRAHGLPQPRRPGEPRAADVQDARRAGRVRRAEMRADQGPGRGLARNAALRHAAREQGAANAGQDHHGEAGQNNVPRVAYVAYQRGYVRMRDHRAQMEERNRREREREANNANDAHVPHYWAPVIEPAGPEDGAVAADRQVDRINVVQNAAGLRMARFYYQVQPQPAAGQQQTARNGRAAAGRPGEQLPGEQRPCRRCREPDDCPKHNQQQPRRRRSGESRPPWPQRARAGGRPADAAAPADAHDAAAHRGEDLTAGSIAAAATATTLTYPMPLRARILRFMTAVVLGIVVGFLVVVDHSPGGVTDQDRDRSQTESRPQSDQQGLSSIDFCARSLIVLCALGIVVVLFRRFRGQIDRIRRKWD